MKKLRDIWDQLPNLEHTRKYIDEKSGLRIYEVCGKCFQETARLDYVIPILEKFYESYGHRAKQAKRNEGIDWKAVSHAIRAAFQIKELLLDNTITFPLKQADLLVKIKRGKLDFLTEVSPLLENLMTEVAELSVKSNLPTKPDIEFWEDFLYNTLYSRVCSLE